MADVVIRDRPAFDDQRSFIIERAALFGIAARDRARATRAGVAYRKRGSRSDGEDAAEKRRGVLGAVERIAVQIERDRLAADQKPQITALGGKALTERDGIAVLRVVDRGLQLRPARDRNRPQRLNGRCLIPAAYRRAASSRVPRLRPSRSRRRNACLWAR